jgi:hypothetical protein
MQAGKIFPYHHHPAPRIRNRTNRFFFRAAPEEKKESNKAQQIQTSRYTDGQEEEGRVKESLGIISNMAEDI